MFYFFYGHKDLRRILNNYGFNGYSLRKDFSLNGYVSFRYDDLNKIIENPTEHQISSWKLPGLRSFPGISHT